MSDTFCIYPYFHISVERNGLYTCCGASMEYSKHNVYSDTVETAWNDEFFTKLRNDLNNGIRHDNCKVCWYHEDNGVESRRQRANLGYRQLVEQVKETNKPLPKPIHVHTRVENICNLKCVMCNSYHSSQHEKELTELKEQNIELPKWFKFVEEKNIIRINPETAKKNTVAHNLKEVLTKATRLEIEGGEPLLASMTWELLDYCIEHNHTDVNIEIVSNLTSLTDEMIEKLSNFTNLSVWISWDHLEHDKFRFIRFPADYDIFLKQFEKIKQLPYIKLGISYTTNVFNVFDIPETLTYFEGLQRDNILKEFIVMRHVFQPNYFNSNYLEPEQRLELVEKLSKFREESKDFLIFKNRDLRVILDDIIDILQKQPEDFIEVCKERTRMLDVYDNIRRTDYKSLFPYIKRYE